MVEREREMVEGRDMGRRESRGRETMRNMNTTNIIKEDIDGRGIKDGETEREGEKRRIKKEEEKIKKDNR